MTMAVAHELRHGFKAHGQAQSNVQHDERQGVNLVLTQAKASSDLVVVWTPSHPPTLDR
jgi:hypothetical protein